MKPDNDIEVLIAMAEKGTDEEAKWAMVKLREINPSYHWCFEWDEMVICDTDIEFECCICNTKGNSDAAR